jgi:hypothetical protein
VFRLGQPGDVIRGRSHLAEAGTSALQRVLDGGHRHVEKPGDLGGWPRQHVAQDQHGALA